MIEIEDLEELAPPLLEAAHQDLVARLAAGEISSTAALADAARAMGGSWPAFERACLALKRLVRSPSDAAVQCFSLIWSWGEQDALRRVSLVLSDPRARGRELEVVKALQAGADIEAALQRTAAPEAQERAVVPFRR